MVEAAEQHRPLAPSEVSAALEWNRVEENRYRGQLAAFAPQPAARSRLTCLQRNTN